MKIIKKTAEWPSQKYGPEEELYNEMFFSSYNTTEFYLKSTMSFGIWYSVI